MLAPSELSGTATTEGDGTDGSTVSRPLEEIAPHPSKTIRTASLLTLNIIESPSGSISLQVEAQPDNAAQDYLQEQLKALSIARSRLNRSQKCMGSTSDLPSLRNLHGVLSKSRAQDVTES